MIQGRNILIYEGDVVIAAAKSCTINNNAEALENSSPASGTARSYTVGRTGWDISISTLVLGMKDHLLKVGQAYRMVWKVRGNDSDTMQGTAICTNAQVAATVGNLAQGSFQFLGSDDNGTIVTPPTPTPSDYVTEQDVVNIINQYDFTTEQWVQNYAGIANGVITIGTNSISPVSSVAMTVPTGFFVSGSPITKTGTLALAYATGYEGFTTALKNKIEEIYSWFEVDAAGDIKTKNTAGGHVRGLYSESFVSSLGKNSSSGGGGVDLTAVWASLTNTESPTYSKTLKININHIPNIGWSKITSKPSTISGYGISDAKIANGTITLGSNTITPLTASSSLAWGKLTGTPTTLAGYGIGDAKIANGVITLGSSTITPVTSVGLSAPTGFSVSGSPVTKTGTLTFDYASGYEGFTTLLKEKIEALYSWFEVDANGDVKTKDTAGGHVRGFYTESFVSALGKNSQGGSSTFDEDQMWEALGTDTTTTKVIATSHIPDMASTYGYLKSSALSGYATQSWVNQQGFLTTHQTLYTLSIYGGTTKVLDFKPNANASIYIKAGGDISLTNDTTNKYITLSYTHPTNGANTTISAASGKVLSAITVNSLGHVTSVSSKTLASADIPDLSSTYATSSRATTLEGYFNTGGVAKVAAKLNTGTTTYTAWGQTYWSSGVPQSISGNMTSVGSITPSANGNALGTSSARFNIYGTSGNFSGNVSITGTLGVTGATTLSSTLSVAGGITLTTTKRIYFGDTSHYLELDSTGFHFSHGVYSDSFVSTLGSNSSGGGSGGIDIEAMWAELQGNTGTYENAKINWNHIPLATSTTAGAIKVGSTLAISSGVLNQKSGIATAGTYRSVTVDTYGRVTAGTNPTTLSGYGISDAYTKTQVDNALGGYLPLSGGTLTGNVTFNAVNKGIYLTDSNGDTYAAIINNAENLWIGARAATDTHHAGNTYISAGSGSAYINRLANSARANYLILDSGNYSSYALPLSGGQMTGHLTWKDTTALPKTTTPLFMLTMDRFDDGGTTRYANLEDVTVGKATTLETSRTIWGQSFDGSANITGALSSVTSITMSSHINMNNNTSIRSKDTDGTARAIVSYNSSNHLYLGYDVPASGGSTFIYGTNIGFRTNGTGTANQAMYITSGQNVGIGTDTPGYKLGVVGNIGISGDIYLHNTGTIYAKDSTDTDRSILTFTSSNQLILGSDVPAAGGTTYIMGNIIDIRAGGAAASNRTIYITAAQNVGIGTTNPSQKLHVVGNILASGEVTASSDERKKNIISNTKFNVKDIASARSIIYEWNDGRDKDNSKKIHGGSIAQDWLGKADSFLLQDDDGFYSINYGALALCSAITIAREVLKHSDEIDRLKQEVSYLKARVAELEERRIA